MLEALLPGAQHLQNLHPLVVHYPLAFLSVAAILYPVAWAAGRDSWAWTALWLLLLGVISTAAAVSTGLYAEPGVRLTQSVRNELLEPHEEYMIASSVLAGGLGLWAYLEAPLPRRGRAVFVLLLFVLLGVLARGADYGGRMVFDYNAGGSAAAQPIEFGK